MKIEIQRLPDEGAQLTGDLDSAFLQEGAKFETYTGPVHYDVFADKSAGGLLVTGSLSVPVELHCARCDTPFGYELRAEEFAIFEENTSIEEIDLTEPIREELLLKLPLYPHCDEEGGLFCPGHALLKKVHEEAKFDESKEGQPDSRWGGLDGLKLE